MEKWDERTEPIKCTSQANLLRGRLEPAPWGEHRERQNRPQRGGGRWVPCPLTSVPPALRGEPKQPPMARGLLRQGLAVSSPRITVESAQGPWAGHSPTLTLLQGLPAVKSDHLRGRKENLSFKKGIYVNYCQMFWLLSYIPSVLIETTFFFFSEINLLRAVSFSCSIRSVALARTSWILCRTCRILCKIEMQWALV